MRQLSKYFSKKSNQFELFKSGFCVYQRTKADHDDDAKENLKGGKKRNTLSKTDSK